MFADIFLVIRLKATKTIGMKQDKNNHNLDIIYTVELVTMRLIFVFNHIFFLLQRKILAKIIGHTISVTLNLVE